MSADGLVSRDLIVDEYEQVWLPHFQFIYFSLEISVGKSFFGCVCNIGGYFCKNSFMRRRLNGTESMSERHAQKQRPARFLV